MEHLPTGPENRRGGVAIAQSQFKFVYPKFRVGVSETRQGYASGIELAKQGRVVVLKKICGKVDLRTKGPKIFAPWASGCVSEWA